MKKVLVSGIKPTGELHFGNYFGAMRQNINVSNQKDFDSYVFIADYHALTSINNQEDAVKLKEYTHKMFASYVACGLNPELIFKQSSVPEHVELSMIFSNLVTVPYMMRAHAFKDHEAKNKEVNVGLFTYPILMSADILIYDADVVPVGRDQKQHVEYARDIAGYFNNAYKGEHFKLPNELIVDDVAILPGIDGRKMSKSYDNYIELFCDEETLKKKVMSIVTDSARPEDSKDPDTNNIYNIHKHFINEAENKTLREKYINGGYSYKNAKEDLFNAILNWRSGKIEIYNDIMSDTNKIDSVLTKNAERARIKAQAKMKDIRKVVGLD